MIDPSAFDLPADFLFFPPCWIRYADETSTPIIAGWNNDQANAAMLSYTGNDGHEELHVFFTMAWFDSESWAWAHYVHEWVTKGIFMVRLLSSRGSD